MAHILLVDDDDLFRNMLGITLGKLGHTVVPARDGREALRLFRVTSVELVLTDLVMPEKEGIETIRELRALKPDVKIVAMTGGNPSDARDYLKMASLMGAARTLNKPFSHDELTEAIAAALGG
ncbi:MAG TPA: response regulator [Opitutaceae bacterium]